jgi:Rod binding domain-containing protein
MTTPLNPIDSAQLPADVRKAGAKAEQLYSAALAFESVLTNQLAQAMTSTLTDGSGDSDGSGDDGTTSLYAQQLPQAFTDGVTSAGGLGLARDLYEALKQS